MTIRKTALSRRTLLRGAGVSLGLPWLEAMAATSATPDAVQKSPVRMAVLYVPNGVNMSELVSRRRRPRLHSFADARTAAGPQERHRRAEQSVECGIERRRRALCQGSRDPHVHHDQENAGRRYRQRHLDGSGCRAAHRSRDSASVPGTRHLARSDRRRRRSRIHTRLRIAHRMEQSHDSAGARDQSALRV